MESTRGPAARVYQDFEPSMEWVPEDDSDTLLVYLPSFAKEQLRVQMRARNLIISGERKLQQQNNNTWSRFRVEFPVSVNCDLNKISAKFEGNILFVRQPKLKMNMIIPTATTSTTSAAAAAADQKPPPPPLLVDDHESLHHHHHKTTADIEDDQLAAKMGLEKTSHQIAQPKDTSSSNKTTSTDDHDHHPLLEEEKQEAVNNNNNNNAPDDADHKTVLDDEVVGGGQVFATKASFSCRNAVNTIVILLLGLLIGIYVSNSWPTTKLTSSPTVDVLVP
uniref:inactive protein RESTRICTED TEV MOVEMENT 2-like n=1 Tax=Erigeron canadensis TaxID=72917 RepID=UPI001CB927B9|nr:inactive protein RESTRICTED TEV MOVEMENT 2-like [Erigeron canadensis]